MAKRIVSGFTLEKGVSSFLILFDMYLEKAISQIKRMMEKAARDLDFMEAAKLSDEMFRLQKEPAKWKNNILNLIARFQN